MQRGTHDALPDERNKDILVYVNGEFYPRDEALMVDPTCAVSTCNATN
jgi:hypothetical protein